MIEILDKKGLSGIVKLIIDIVFIVGISIYLSLPFTLKWYFGLISRFGSENYYFLLGFLYLNGAFYISMVYEMKKIFKTLNRRNPFLRENVKSFKLIALLAFASATTYFIKIFLYNSILTIIVAATFLMIGLFSLIMSEVFNQAVYVKEENDMTI